jgi:SecD/SecF fusion protein
MKILKHDSVDALLPLDLTFHWGPGEYLETGEQTMALLACKKGRNYEMGGENISEAKKLYNAQSGNPSPEITIIFNAAGATAWEKMTSANVGRSLAIEVDNFVYSYPTVVSPITGGLATITGRFTDMEAEQLVLILKSGKMPAPAKIVSETEF